VCSHQEGHCEKRCEIQGGGQGMAVTIGKRKFLIMTIQGNLCCLLHDSLGFGTKFTLIVGFHIFFHNDLLGGRTLFLQLGCVWIRYELPNIGLVSSFFFFLERCLSYHKAETGDVIALKFGTQKGGAVRAHLAPSLLVRIR